jgi:hypothetical protein
LREKEREREGERSKAELRVKLFLYLYMYFLLVFLFVCLFVCFLGDDAAAAAAAFPFIADGAKGVAGFASMNQRIAECLLGVLSPVVGMDRENTSRRNTDAWELVASVAPSALCKFLQAGTSVMPTKAAAPLSVFQLADKALKQIPRGSSSSLVAIATQCIVRVPPKSVHPDDFGKV